MKEGAATDPPAGLASALGTLRHALADPLSAAGLKLELLERRLAAPGPDGAALAVRARSARTDVACAGRLVELLSRLAAVVAEEPGRTDVVSLCREAGIRLEGEAGGSGRPLTLRRQATLDALRAVAGFIGPAGAPPLVRAEAAAGRERLRLEACEPGAGPGDGDTERLLCLPTGVESAGDLFLARAAIECDGGDLRLGVDRDRLVALVSWPVRPAAAAGRPAP